MIEKPRIVYCCGGRAASHIAAQLAQQSDLTCVINALDDGLSTGVARRYFDMLGPSDVRKLHSVLMADRLKHPLELFYRYRFATDTTYEQGIDLLSKLFDGDVSGLAESLMAIPAVLRQQLFDCLRAFVREQDRLRPTRGKYDFSDCAIANLIYVGAYILHGRNFTRACQWIGEAVGAVANVLPVSDTQRWLVGINQNGDWLRSEYEIDNQDPFDVAYTTSVATQELLSKPLRTRDTRERVDFLESNHIEAPLSSAVAAQCNSSNAVVIGPGSLHTSILATLRTRAFSKCLSTSSKLTIFIPNTIGSERDLRLACMSAQLLSECLTQSEHTQGGTSLMLLDLRMEGSLASKGSSCGLFKPYFVDMITEGPYARHDAVKTSTAILNLLRETP